MGYCQKCKSGFREPADEQGDHGCPRCGRVPRLKPLHFTYDYSGEWTAESGLPPEIIGEDEVPLLWVIGVCDDGTFDVSKSDARLTDRKECFPTLDKAKEFCRGAEKDLLAEMTEE
jgi:hypothetical protein